MCDTRRVWVLGQWFSAETVRRIEAVVDSEPQVSRRMLARRVCEWLRWFGANGAPREDSGRKALGELERRGVIVLPRARKLTSVRSNGARAGARQGAARAPVQQVECGLDELDGVEVVAISSRYSKDSRAWSELMRQHHYLGAGSLYGAQIRYLIRDERHVVLGALSFSAASKRLKQRDAWIGWSERARRANIHRVVCNSRFLIPSYVKVPHLASHALGLALKRLPQDFQERYGYAPVLVETFVDGARFCGTCYKAANFQLIGETAGREQGFENGKKPTGKKQIFVYPLGNDCKAQLCDAPSEPLVIRGRSADATDWADEEFGGAQVFEGRLRSRLASLARDFFKQPGKSIPAASAGCEAKVRAAYRFFANERLDMQALLSGHIAATLQRAAQHETVLAVQDTTTVNYTAHSCSTGLGPINTTKDSGTGLVVHSTIGFSVAGTPLGILDVQCWAREREEAGKKRTRHERPIEEKESCKWLRSYRAVAAAQRLCPNTMFVSTGDREADIHELFLEAQETKDGPKLLIRANKSCQRKVTDAGREDYEYLWDKLAKEPQRGTLEIRIPRQGSRPARDATLEVRFAKVLLQPPKSKPKLDPVEIIAVHAREVAFAPSVKEPVDWMLVTTVAVEDFADAVERIRGYSLRWGIEVFHRVLKSGTRVEDRQLGDAASIKNCLAVDMVVAWRIHWLTVRRSPTGPPPVRARRSRSRFGTRKQPRGFPTVPSAG
mgnify:FL=1